MNFGWAIDRMAEGKKVRRADWALSHTKYIYKDKYSYKSDKEETAEFIFYPQNIEALDWALSESEPEYEYLQGDGTWEKDDKGKEYKINFQALNYNFNGIYNYCISDTEYGYKVIWRKRYE